MPQNPYANTNTSLAPKSALDALRELYASHANQAPHPPPQRPDLTQEDLDSWGEHTKQGVPSFDANLPDLPSFPDRPTPPAISSGSTSSFANRNDSLATDSLGAAALRKLKGLFSQSPQSPTAPPQQASASSTPSMGQDINLPAEPNHSGNMVSLAESPYTKVRPAGTDYGAPRSLSGTATYSGTPGDMYKDGSFDNFTKGQYQPSNDGITLEELFKIRDRSPEETAPGAQAWAQELIPQHLGEPSETDLALQKIQAPIQQQEVAGRYDVKKQQEANKGALAVQESRGGQAENFFDLLQKSSMSGLNPLGRASFNPQSGAVSISPGKVPQVDQGLLNRLTAARATYEDAKAQSHWYNLQDNLPPAKAQFDQAAAAVLDRYPASDPSIKDFVHGILSDPNADHLTLDQILDATGQTGNVTPQEKAEIQQILNLLRGH